MYVNGSHGKSSTMYISTPQIPLVQEQSHVLMVLLLLSVFLKVPLQLLIKPLKTNLH